MALQSFFEKLTGNQSEKENNKAREETAEQEQDKQKNSWLQPSRAQGQVTLDIFQTPKEIVIQAPIAGADPEDIDISISNDMVTIAGGRENLNKVQKEDYLYQEIYWGDFSRSVVLPQEVDAAKSEAQFKNGLLTIRLPKLEREKTQKIRVKAD